MKTDIAFTYLHIGDSGLTVSVQDAGRGPVLCFSLETFGHPATITVSTTVEAVREVGEMLLSAVNSGHPWGEPYCMAANLCASRRGGQEQVVFDRPTEGSSVIDDPSEDDGDTD